MQLLHGRNMPGGKHLAIGPQCHNDAMQNQRVAIQNQDFDLAAEVAALRAGDRRVGAVCSFIGTVRDRNDGSDVSTLELEHYPGMTEKAIEAMLDEAHRRFDIFAVGSMPAWPMTPPCSAGASRPATADRVLDPAL